MCIFAEQGGGKKRQKSSFGQTFILIFILKHDCEIDNELCSGCFHDYCTGNP